METLRVSVEKHIKRFDISYYLTSISGTYIVSDEKNCHEALYSD